MKKFGYIIEDTIKRKKMKERKGRRRRRKKNTVEMAEQQQHYEADDQIRMLMRGRCNNNKNKLEASLLKGQTTILFVLLILLIGLAGE